MVDDDPQTLRYVRGALADAGYNPVVVAEPEEALLAMEESRPGLALLDVVLPDADGIELMRDILSIADVPVIFISAYGHDEVVARAFEAGADDYIVKPFSPTELVARVRAALRRRTGYYQSQPPVPYVYRDLTIDYAQRRVTFAGRPVELRDKEYRLLYELSVNAGRVVPHDELLRRIWGAKRPDNLRALRTHLRRIRSHFGEEASNPTYFFAEPRVGYRMPTGEGQEEPSAVSAGWIWKLTSCLWELVDYERGLEDEMSPGAPATGKEPRIEYRLGQGEGDRPGEAGPVPVESGPAQTGDAGADAAVGTKRAGRFDHGLRA